MRYCSFETRKVIDAIEAYGPLVAESDYLSVEQTVGTFWNTHIQKVVADIMRKGNSESKLARIDLIGVWDYFKKPVISLLTPRGGAARTDPIEFEITEQVERVYNLVTASLCLADFNMTELKILTVDIPPMVADLQLLSYAIGACKQQNKRTIYYLNGIIQREYQTTQGKIREIQQQTRENLASGWSVPQDFEPADAIERKQLDLDWQDCLASIRLSKELDVR